MTKAHALGKADSEVSQTLEIQEKKKEEPNVTSATRWAYMGLGATAALGLVAHGLPTLLNESRPRTLEAIRELVEARDVGEIVVGLPRNMDGSLGPQAQKAMEFARAIEVLGLPVHLVDERLTTERAERALREAGVRRSRRRSRRDRVAAQFILQSYLDQKRARGSRDSADPRSG